MGVLPRAHVARVTAFLRASVPHTLSRVSASSSLQTCIHALTL